MIGGPRGIAMVWECPVCGAQFAQMTDTDPRLPKCDYGHEPVEMEQRLATAWNASVAE